LTPGEMENITISGDLLDNTDELMLMLKTEV